MKPYSNLYLAIKCLHIIVETLNYLLILSVFRRVVDSQIYQGEPKRHINSTPSLSVHIGIACDLWLSAFE